MATLTFCDVAKGKQARREKLIPAVWRATDEQLAQCRALAKGRTDWALHLPDIVLSAQEREITATSAVQLLHRMWDANATQPRWTARQVTEAFAKRAALAHQVTNALTEILFDEALQRADALDAEYAKTGAKPSGMLAGVPISIKDNFNIAGVDSTLGFVCWANDPQKTDSLLIRILREQGAILYCKTNVPTAMMIPETLNNTWGRTVNPHNLACTPGGSSGGEGALLAMRGSPLGVGTDIGGSVRIPSALSGVYGLKPSLGRFPTYGARSAMAGQESVHSINGPMSPDLESLSLFAAAVVGWQPWRFDPKCVPIPWTPVTLPKTGLAFGLLLDNGCVHPEPPITRALLHTKQKLEQAGHTVVEWKAVDEHGENVFADCERILSSMFGMDGGAAINQLMKDGHEDDHWVPGLSRGGPTRTISESWKIQAERWKVGAKIYEKWEALGIDALLSPATPHAAVKHDGFVGHVIYTGAWNLLDQPGATLPVLNVDVALDAKADHQPAKLYGEKDEYVWKQYDEKAIDGMPVSIQVVGRRLQEEKLLAVVERIAEALAVK